jgi:hypothetical protein
MKVLKKIQKKVNDNMGFKIKFIRKISNKIKSDFDLEFSKKNILKASEKLAIKDQNFIISEKNGYQIK